ncbi:MAG: pirin family protein, partial [Betaproteobacteria bacterium]|nr:pirin family protein [Betaproteobacteria bacterium]
AYPAGNAQMGPQASLEGRDIGQDFAGKDGWRMYHGNTVPGFPAHPHRGFETVTIVRQGFIDHSDSLGATARFGPGDVQWLTAGKGIVHCEMFPLRNAQSPNPAELFQIWLNLPAQSKMVEPHFTMHWGEQIPAVKHVDAQGLATEVQVVAGALEGAQAAAPPPDSWARRPESAGADTLRQLYYFEGEGLQLDGQSFPGQSVATLRGPHTISLRNGGHSAQLLLLQARPIGEPVAQYGPFVMNTQAEIHQAFADYRRTEFGGWPWPQRDPVHPRSTAKKSLSSRTSLAKKTSTATSW